MIFGTLPLDAALGAVSAHTHRLPGRLIRKGATLDPESLDALRAAGLDSVVAARLEPGDVAENPSAERVARLLAAPGLAAGPAGTGRVNLHAEHAGLLRVAAATIDALNGIDEAVTVATLPDYTVVAAREMVATVKIIPFAVPGRVLARVETASAARPLQLLAFQALRTGLIVTELPGLKRSVIEATIAATRARIAALGGMLLPPRTCAHDTAAIAAALHALQADGAALLLVAGASATVDRRDVAPAAIVACGGEITHFGMPVDPGNLICLGHIHDAPALVLPGCARSPRLNGIDWVLQRLFAGVPVDAAAVMRLGVGGLLKEANRPLPRARAVPRAAAPDASRVAAIVLAAGQSSRMAPHSKLLLRDAAGGSMVARVVDNVLASQARPVVVVLGHRAEEVRASLGARPVRCVVAADHAAGLSASLRAGLSALPAETEAALVCLGDMPLVNGRLMDRLIAAWNPADGRRIVQPTWQGGAGNPVLWDRSLFSELSALAGDSGGRQLLSRHREAVERLEVDDDSVLRDFDTLDSLAALPPALRPDVARMRAG